MIGTIQARIKHVGYMYKMVIHKFEFSVENKEDFRICIKLKTIKLHLSISEFDT